MRVYIPRYRRRISVVRCLVGVCPHGHDEVELAVVQGGCYVRTVAVYSDDSGGGGRKGSQQQYLRYLPTY